MSALLRVVVSQPACILKDVKCNAQAHAEVVRQSDSRLVVFPELSLTGYHFDAEPITLNSPELDLIVDACAEGNSIALVGVLVESSAAGKHITMLRVDALGVSIAYRKRWLGSHERTHFVPRDGPTVLTVDTWRIGLGVCKDTGVSEHVNDLAALGVDLYVAGVLYRNHELEEQEERAVRIARACQSYVAFASFAGPTGEGYDVAAGNSAIWTPQGRPLVQAADQPGAIVQASIERSSG